MTDKVKLIRASIMMTRINACCDKCASGFYRFTGQVIDTNPPIYVHQCDTCGVGTELERQYPAVEYGEEKK